MKRRLAIQSLLGLPGISALPMLAQQAPTDKTKPSSVEKLPPELKPPPIDEFPKLAVVRPDAAVAGEAKFFSSSQLETLRHLAGILFPASAGRPGAAEASAPEFLDFLIGKSPATRQRLYRTGLDKLDSDARHRFGKSFPHLTAVEADSLLAALHQPWSHQGPADELGRFLEAAKEDLLRATMNSREFLASSGQRRASGLGTYWHALD